MQPLSIQWTQRLLRGGQPGEHFGFADGGSQPVFDPAQAGRRYPKLVHVGEVLCSHANRVNAAWSVSLRAVLEAEPGYAADHTLFWSDELHATERGYQRLADEFLRVLDPLTLPPPPSS